MKKKKWWKIVYCHVNLFISTDVWTWCMILMTQTLWPMKRYHQTCVCEPIHNWTLFQHNPVDVYPVNVWICTVYTPSMDLYSLSCRTSLRISRKGSMPRDWGLNILIALKFDRPLGSSAAEMPVKFQNDTVIRTSNLVASRLHEIWR